MEKTLLCSMDDFVEWAKQFGRYSNIDYLIKYANGAPKSYPCMAIWTEWDIPGSSYDGGRLDYVYPFDFQTDSPAV